MTRIEDPMKLVADLKPPMLDRLAEEGYLRRRHDDLARAVAEGPISRSPQRKHQVSAGHGARRWSLLAGGSAVTAAAAAAAVVLATAPAPPHSGPHARPPAAAGNQRAVLLVSAVVANDAPTAGGHYWYVRERDYEPTASRSKKTFAGPQPRKQTFGAMYAATEEEWIGPDSGRTIVDEDVKITFPTAADEARWKAAGGPKLAVAAGFASPFGHIAPVTSNYRLKWHWGYGTNTLSWSGVRALPVTTAALGKTLRRMWNAEPDKAAAVGFPHPDFSEYLVQWAATLLTGPARPGTRAAIYRLLAGQAGVQIVGHVTDPLGRSGVAISDAGGDSLVIDPRTAQVLAHTSNPVKPGETMAGVSGVTVYEATGWADQLGGPAQP